MTTFTKEQLQQIEAAAKEALWPVVWSEKKARAHFSKKITPQVLLELARIALQSLDAKPIAWTDNDELDDARKGYSAYLFALDGEANKFADPRRKIMLYTAPPVQPVSEPKLPEGWKLVPIEPTEEMIVEGFESEPDKTFSKPEVWEEYAAMSGCKQAAHRAKLCWAAMLAAAPDSESE